MNESRKMLQKELKKKEERKNKKRHIITASNLTDNIISHDNLNT